MPRLATYIEPPNVPRNRSSSDLSAWLHRESDGSYAPRRTVDDGTLGDATPGRIGIAEAPATLVSQHDAATPRAGIPPPPVAAVRRTDGREGEPLADVVAVGCQECSYKVDRTKASGGGKNDREDWVRTVSARDTASPRGPARSVERPLVLAL